MFRPCRSSLPRTGPSAFDDPGAQIPGEVGAEPEPGARMTAAVRGDANGIGYLRDDTLTS
jgi:hypothetical protein